MKERNAKLVRLAPEKGDWLVKFKQYGSDVTQTVLVEGVVALNDAVGAACSQMQSQGHSVSDGSLTRRSHGDFYAIGVDKFHNVKDAA